MSHDVGSNLSLWQGPCKSRRTDPATVERSTAVTVHRTLTALVPSVTPALSSRRHIDLVRVASSGCR